MAHKLSITGAMLSLLAASGLPALADDASTAPAAPYGTIVKGPLANASDTSSAVQLKLTYTGEAWDNRGGFTTGTNYMQGGDASLSIDASKYGWTGASFYAEGFYVGGKSLSLTRTGSTSAQSALDAFNDMNVFRLYQAYYEQRIAHTDILLGIYDVQAQFGHTQPTEVFFNRAIGMSTALLSTGYYAGLNGASTYPDTTLGLRVKQQINDQWTAKFGLLNGMAGNPTNPKSNEIIINNQTGVMAIGEIDYTPIARTKLMAGYWGYTGKFTTWELNPDFTRHQAYGANGGYLGGATRIYTIEGSRGVDAFVNLGGSTSATNIVDRSGNAGLTVTGLYGGRPHDKLGFSVGVLREATPFRNYYAMAGVEIPKYETTYELTYRASIADWLTVQPDVQYVVHPALAFNRKNAFVFGIHFELSKLFNML